MLYKNCQISATAGTADMKNITTAKLIYTKKIKPAKGEAVDSVRRQIGSYFVSIMFCWESFILEGRFSVGAEEQVPMQKTGGSCAMKLK